MIQLFIFQMTTHKHQRHNKFYYQPSTFMQAYEPPVYMSDDEEGGYVNETNHVGDVSVSNKKYLPSIFLVSLSKTCTKDYRFTDMAKDGTLLTNFIHLSKLLSPSQDDETVPVRLRNTNEYQELMKLKRIRKQRLQDVGADSGIAHHVGYKVCVKSVFLAFLKHSLGNHGFRKKVGLRLLNMYMYGEIFVPILAVALTGT